MAGMNQARRERGRYSQAGYTGAYHAQEERELYIAKAPAGSLQDELVDYNRIGYRSDRPWHEAPVPVFEAETVAAPLTPARKRVQRETFFDRLAYHARRERRDFAVCILLLAAILMMTALWGRNLVEGKRLQDRINSYHAQTIAFEKENERLIAQLEMAKGGERIRNLAQNELHMLRPERANTVTIYIQAPDTSAQTSLQQNEEPRMELLDILLGLLDVLHIGE